MTNGQQITLTVSPEQWVDIMAALTLASTYHAKYADTGEPGTLELIQSWQAIQHEVDGQYRQQRRVTRYTSE